MLQRIRRTIIALCTVLLILGLGAYWGSMLWINLNAEQLATQLETELGPHLEIGAIAGDLFTGLRIEGIRFGADPTRERNPSATPPPVIEAALCRLQLDWAQLFEGQVKIQRVRLADVVVDLRRDKERGFLWPSLLVRQEAAQGVSLAGDPFDWSIVNGTLRIHFADDRQKPLEMTIPAASGRFDPTARFQIARCHGRVLDSEWTLAGELALDGTQDLSGYWQLKEAGLWTLGSALLGASLPPLPSESEGEIRPVDTALIPSGTVSGKLALGGTLADPTLSGHLIWTKGSIRSFQIERGEFTAKWRPGVVEIEEAVIKAYEGRLAANAQIDLRSAPPAYHFYAKTEGVALGDYLAAAGWSKVGLTGTFGGFLEGAGQLHRLDSFTASGHLEAADGRSRNPVYEQTTATFPEVIDYSQIATDIRLTSEHATLTHTTLEAKDLKIQGDGTIRFDGGLDCQATLTAPASAFSQHSLFSAGLAALGLGKMLVDLPLTLEGTVAAPRVRTQAAGTS